MGSLASGIPKTIHLCWFSGKKYPVEIRKCIDSWKKILPDYEIRVWTEDDARSIGCRYVDEALDMRKWAFAADVIRFYALWKEGGVYMDSDILLWKRFDEFIPERGFATFHESLENLRLQAAFLIGAQGNEFCRRMVDYYMNHSFIKPDGSYDMTISPVIMLEVAETLGYRLVDEEQHLDKDTVIYPGYFLVASNHSERHPDAFGIHTIYGSWRKRKIGRKIELSLKHLVHLVQYNLARRK